MFDASSYVDRYFGSIIKVDETELIAVESLNDYSTRIAGLPIFDDLSDEDRRLIRHELIHRFQREVFILALKYWVKDNYKRSLTNKEITNIRSQFKVYDDFTDTSITDEKRSWIKHSRLLDSFVSCDIFENTNIVCSPLYDNIVAGFSKKDLEIPLYKNKTINYPDDSVWLKMLVEHNVEKARELVHTNANNELKKFVEFIHKYMNDVKEQVKASTRLEDIQTKIEERSNALFDESSESITETNVERDLKFRLVFNNYKEAYKCIDYMKCFVWEGIDFSRVNWLMDYIGSYDFYYLCTIMDIFDCRIINSKYPEYQNYQYQYGTPK